MSNKSIPANLSMRDWRIYFRCDVAGESKSSVAKKIGCHRKTVDRRLRKVRELVHRDGLIEEFRRAMLPLAEKAIAQVEKKIDEGDTNVLNAFLKGTGIYTNLEKKPDGKTVYIDLAEVDRRSIEIEGRIAKQREKAGITALHEDDALQSIM